MDEDRAARRITLAGGFVNLVLTSLQAVGGVIFGSVALLADALHSLTASEQLKPTRTTPTVTAGSRPWPRSPWACSSWSSA